MVVETIIHDVVLNVLQLVLAGVVAAIGYAATKVRKAVTEFVNEKKDHVVIVKKIAESQLLQDLVAKAVQEAEVKMTSGSDKFHFVSDKVSALLHDKGIDVTPAEISAVIESEVSKLPKSLDPSKWLTVGSAGTTISASAGTIKSDVLNSSSDEKPAETAKQTPQN